MQWNLVENLSIPGFDRTFSLPLSAIPPDQSSATMASASQFSLSDNINDADYYSAKKMPILTVAIQPNGTETTFPDVSVTVGTASVSIPNPAIRLHAMSMGELYFEAANTRFSKDHLILKMPMFGWKFFSEVPWYERWHDADCLPHQVIYENIDTSFCDTLLSNIPIGSSWFGTSFPPKVTDEITKADFIAKFKAGTVPLTVSAGAIIGRIMQSTDGTKATATLMLHGRYARHSDASVDVAWPMNPREFIYLLFGDDSYEATGATSDHSDRHPFLAAMEAKGDDQIEVTAAEASGSDASKKTLLPAARSMKLRPPLRTHARLLWEGSIEKTLHQSDWKESGAVDENSIYNRVSMEMDSVTHTVRVCDFDSGYSGDFKCNVFAFDISLRAGFRASIIPFDTSSGSKKWRYMTLLGINQAVTKPVAGNAGDAKGRIPLMGAGDDKSKKWAFIIENQVQAVPLLSADGTTVLADRMNYLNKLIDEEGRCLAIPILSGSTGHFLLLKTALGVVVMAGDTIRSDDVGIRKIQGTMMQAGVSTGASDWTSTFTVKDEKVGTISMRLLELHPGGDPDHYWGMIDLNVRNKTNWG